MCELLTNNVQPEDPNDNVPKYVSVQHLLRMELHMKSPKSDPWDT